MAKMMTIRSKTTDIDTAIITTILLPPASWVSVPSSFILVVCSKDNRLEFTQCM